MSRSASAATRSLAALGVAAMATAWVCVAALELGASPLQLAGAAAVLPLAIALAGLLPMPRGAGWSIAALLCPLAVAGVGPLGGWIGPLVGDPERWAGLLAALAVLTTLPAAGLALQSWRGTSPEPVVEALGAAAGVGLCALLPPALVALAAAVSLGLADLARRKTVPDDDSSNGQDTLGPARVVAVALSAFSIFYAWAWLRPLTDPSPAGLLLAGAVAAFVAALTRNFGPTRGAGATVLAAGGVALVEVALWKGPGLARALVLSAVADAGVVPAPLIIATPMALAAVGTGAVVGLAWGPRRAHPLTFLGFPVAVGLLALSASWPPLGLAALIAGSALLWSLWRPAQVGGLVVAVACGLVVWFGGKPSPDALSSGAWRLLRSAQDGVIEGETRASTVSLMARVSPTGAAGLRVPSARWDVDRNMALPGAAPTMLLELDGLISESRGRAAEAETLAGHLAGALPAQAGGTTLVLGDVHGRVLDGLLAHNVSQVAVATPSRDVVRRMAGISPSLEANWLDPRVRLIAAHPSAVLATNSAGAIVEVTRAPWADAWRSAPSPAHFAAVRRHLHSGGVYVLVLHLPWLAPGEPGAIAAQLAGQFAHVQGWLPPFGADSLVLVASDAAPSADALVAAFSNRRGALADLGAKTPEDLLSLAVVDGQALTEWHQTRAGALPSPLALGKALVGRPVLHLADLADRLTPPERTWAITDPDLGAALTTRLSARENFLRLLNEATTGDMEAVFRRARDLQRSGDGVGAASLEPLIDPHLRDGRRALSRAVAEGPTSRAWDDAVRFATTARLLAPTSPRPLVLLADIALGKGRIDQAEDLFTQARELDPSDLSPLMGQARTARMRGDSEGAEQLLRDATLQAPRDWRTWQNLGVFLMQDSRNDDAEAALRQAVQESGGGEAAPLLAQAELMLNTGRPAATLLTADKALALEDSGYGWYLRGRAHFDLGQTERAIDDFQRAVILEPGLAEARIGLGLIFTERGQLDQAAEAFRAVLRLQPDNSIVRESLKRIEEELAILEPAPQR